MAKLLLTYRKFLVWELNNLASARLIASAARRTTTGPVETQRGRVAKLSERKGIATWPRTGAGHNKGYNVEIEWEWPPVVQQNSHIYQYSLNQTIHLPKPWHASLRGLVPPLIPAPFDGSSFRSCSLFRLTGADSAVFAHIPIRPHQRHVVTCYPYGTHPSVPPLILAPFDGSSWLSALRRWPSRSCGRSRCSRRPR